MVGIKEMEMPEECWQCNLTTENHSGYTYCIVTGDNLYPMGSRKTRPDDCPLVEVKEQ